MKRESNKDTIQHVCSEKQDYSICSRMAERLFYLNMIAMIKKKNILFQFNFVGRILGPRGMTAKELETQTGCKIMVRGKGSMRDKVKVSRFCVKVYLSSFGTFFQNLNNFYLNLYVPHNLILV